MAFEQDVGSFRIKDPTRPKEAVEDTQVAQNRLGPRVEGLNGPGRLTGDSSLPPLRIKKSQVNLYESLLLESASPHKYSVEFQAPDGTAKKTKEDELVGLDLSNQGIKNLCTELFNYTFISILRLDGNNLVTLPKEICLMKNLVFLDISRNKLQALPEELGQLVSLKELFIFDNRLRTLPHELGQLHLLKNFGLDGNPLDEPLISVFCDGGASAIMHYLREMCPVGPPPADREWAKIISPNIYKTSENIFLVMSYNVLCNSYANKVHYGYVPSWALNWEYRKDLIMQEILSYMVDIICLQEVEFDKYESFFLERLSRYGNYEGFFWPKTRARTMDRYERAQVDGCATFWKKSNFRFIRGHCIELQQLGLQDASIRCVEEILSKLSNKDNIAIVTLLEHKESNKHLIVANAHLHWDPALPEVKLAQTYLLIKELERLLILWGCCSTPIDIQKFPVILAGDFNSLPISSVYEYIVGGAVPKDHSDLINYPYRKTSLETYKHHMNLKSVYSHIGELEFTNFTPTFKGVIDYIWYSTKSLVPVGVLSGIDPAYVKKIVGFPNAHNPSDHIFLLASFAFKGHC